MGVENVCTKLPKGTPLRQIWSTNSLAYVAVTLFWHYTATRKKYVLIAIGKSGRLQRHVATATSWWMSRHKFQWLSATWELNGHQLNNSLASPPNTAVPQHSWTGSACYLSWTRRIASSKWRNSGCYLSASVRLIGNSYCSVFILGTSGGDVPPKNSKSPQKNLQSIRMHEEIDKVDRCSQQQTPVPVHKT